MSHADHPARGSLRRRIALWLPPPLAVLLGINALLSYRSALEGVNRAYDSSLTASIRAVAERVHSLDGEIQLDIPYVAFEDAAQERIYHAVIDAAGTVLTGYDDLLPPQELPDIGEVRIFDAAYRGYAVRLAVMRKRLYDPAVPVDDWVTILFAETTETRNALARDLFLDSMRLQLALILVGGIVMVLALDSAFRPLLELRDTMRRRDAEDLMPVAADKVPSEVAPLIDAINHHMERLSAMLIARRRPPRRAAAQNHQASHHHGNPHWNRGRRYDGPVNVVRDWDHYHLRQPARGQQWVRTDDGDYLLLEIANQLIVDMLLR